MKLENWFSLGVPIRMIHSDASEQNDFADETHGPSDVAGRKESETSVGEGDLRSEQADVLRATAEDEIVEDEANLIA